MGQRLGQHFLTDASILLAIADAIAGEISDPSQTILFEVGPGQGALTQYISQLTDRFLCLERDEKMHAYLQQLLSSDQVLRGDVLDFELSSLEGQQDQSLVVVGNLPYYITSPILRKFFSDSTQASSGVFLIQKEVAEKVMAGAKKKSYLWWLLNYQYQVEYLFTVPPEAFSPPPKVDSAVISLHKKTAEEFTPLVGLSYEKLLRFLDIVSPFKRKTLGKIQKMRTVELAQLVVSIPESLQAKRLEELGWEEMARILVSGER